MIIPFEELPKYEFALSGISAIRQCPSYQALHVRKRTCNGILLFTEGECRYTFAGGELLFAPGGAAYLPLGSCHEMAVLSRSIEWYRVDFTVTVDGEPVWFSDLPLKLTDSAIGESSALAAKLERECRIGNNTVIKNELLCALFRSLQTSAGSRTNSRLAPAIRFIHENMTEKIDCRELASKCFLSTAQFYHLFHEEFGMAPLEYRDQLLLHRSELLLRSGDISVTEISEMLGFSSPAYFSRFFKKYRNIPPSRYISADM